MEDPRRRHLWRHLACPAAADAVDVADFGARLPDGSTTVGLCDQKKIALHGGVTAPRPVMLLKLATDLLVSTSVGESLGGE